MHELLLSEYTTEIRIHNHQPLLTKTQYASLPHYSHHHIRLTWRSINPISASPSPFSSAHAKVVLVKLFISQSISDSYFFRKFSRFTLEEQLYAKSTITSFTDFVDSRLTVATSNMPTVFVYVLRSLLFRSSSALSHPVFDLRHYFELPPHETSIYMLIKFIVL